MPSKADLRKAALEKRKLLGHTAVAEALAAHVSTLNLSAGMIVGGYHALKDEADPALLLKAMTSAGCHIGFPRITAKDGPLEFHLVPDGELLRPGAYGIHEPLTHWPRVRPDLLLVPLLAFDASGHRLGYGGGFYDRTLEDLKKAHPGLRTIGIAYAGQFVPQLPAEAHDVALDGVLTERGLTTYRG